MMGVEANSLDESLIEHEVRDGMTIAEYTDRTTYIPAKYYPLSESESSLYIGAVWNPNQFSWRNQLWL